MSDGPIIIVYFGGPLDGMEAPLDAQERVEDLQGQSVVLGSITTHTRCVYRFDDQTTGDRLYARYSVIVPPPNDARGE